MVVHFVLNEQGEPMRVADVDEWSRWFERADRSVARTVVTQSCAVLTTFNGVAETTGDEPPLLFETRVFGGVLDGEEHRHATRDAALGDHAVLVAWCRVGNSPDCGVSQEQIA